jgi:tetratricopeptide (TPR) repeat protein
MKIFHSMQPLNVFFLGILVFLSSQVNAEIIHIAPTFQPLENSERFIELDKRNGHKAFSTVNILLSQKSYEKVIESAKNTLESSESALAYEVLGTALYLSGKTKTAIEAFVSATRYNESQSGPFTKLGIAFLSEGRIREAQTSLIRAVRINPFDRYAHQRLGYIYDVKNNVDKAIYHYEKGLSDTDSTTTSSIAVSLASLYIRESRILDAVSLLEPISQRRDSPIPAHLLLGSAYLRLSKISSAKNQFYIADKKGAKQEHTKLAEALVSRQLGQNNDALQNLKQLSIEYPRNSNIHLETGITLLIMEEESKAKHSFQKAINFGANQITIGHILAQYYLQHGDSEAAFNEYEKMSHFENPDEITFVRLAELSQADRKITAGIGYLQKAKEKFPNSTFIGFRLGSFYAANQDYASAVKEYQSILPFQPNNTALLKAITIVQVRLGDNNSALKNATKLFEVEPSTINGLLLAARLEKANRPDVVELYNNLLKEDELNPLLLNNYADYLSNTGDLPLARKLSSKAVAVSKYQNTILLNTLANICLKQQKYKELEQVLIKALTASEHNMPLFLQTTSTLLEREKYIEANHLLNQAKTLNLNKSSHSEIEDMLMKVKKFIPQGKA